MTTSINHRDGRETQKLAGQISRTLPGVNDTQATMIGSIGIELDPVARTAKTMQLASEAVDSLQKLQNEKYTWRDLKNRLREICPKPLNP